MVNAIYCNLAPGPWTAASADLFHTNFQTMFNAIKAVFSTEVGPNEMRFYNVPATPGKYGDPVFIRTNTVKGTDPAAATLPPQVAVTVTFQTAARRHWGRIYLGGLTYTTAVSDGRLTGATGISIGGAMKTFLTNLITNSMPIVVFNRKTWVPQTIVGLSVDDVFDVQRRRRYDAPVNRYQTTIP